MTRYLFPALLLLACGGDDVAGPENGPDHPQITAEWGFSVGCPDATMIFHVESVRSSGTPVLMTGRQTDQLSPGVAGQQDSVEHRVDYIGGPEILYTELANEVRGERSDTMRLMDEGFYQGDGTSFCGYPTGTEWQDGPPLMLFGEQEDP